MNLPLGTRINDPVAVDAEQVGAMLASHLRATIQFSRTGYTPRLLGEVNALCRRFGDALEVRFYGHHGTAFDGAHLAHLPDVGWLSIDCLQSMTGMRAIGVLRALTRLTFGVHDRDEPDLLAGLPLEQITQLVLGASRRPQRIDLTPLARAGRLTYLSLNGHVRNIETVSGLTDLHTVSLGQWPRSADLSFLNRAIALRRLTLILGGRDAFPELRHSALVSLAVLRVRGIATLGDLGRLPALADLQVEDQLQLLAIDVSDLPLRRLRLFNCKNLAAVQGLDSLDRLEELRIGRTALPLEELADRSWPPTLTTVGLYAGAAKRNALLRAALDARGYREWD